MSATFPQHGPSAPAESAAADAAISTPSGVDSRSTLARHWPAVTGGIVVLVAIGWLTFVPRGDDLSPVLNGRRFAAQEQRQAQQTLRESGIADSRFVDGQLLVPKNEVVASNTALSADRIETEPAATSRTTTGSWFDQFATTRRQRTVDESAKAAQLSKLLAQLAGVESAEVVWDEEPRVGRRQAPRVRATVFLQPESGSTIGFETVQAVRAAVAGSRAHLSADDVLVMDLQRRVTYGPQTDAATLVAEQQQAELTAACRARIESALTEFKGAEVTVSLHAARPTAELGVTPAGHARIAGVSGPNLRLEVSQTPAAWTVAPEQQSLVEPPQLVVTVSVPGTLLTEQLGGRRASTARHRLRDADPSNDGTQVIAEHEIRQRVAFAVSGLPVVFNLTQLTIAWTRTHSGPTSSIAANAGPQGQWIDWNAARNLASAFVLRKPVASGMILVATVVLGWTFVRRRRLRNHTPRAESAKPSRRSATPINFLSGFSSTAWAPLVALEPTPIIAALLRRLPPDDVARVMSHLSPVQQRDVLALAPGAGIGDSELEALARRISKAVQKAAPELPDNDPPGRLSTAPPVVRRSPPPFERPAVFDDLLGADELSLRDLASRIPAETWTAALMGAPPKLQRRLSRLNPAVVRSRETTDRRPIRLREIESAQRMIIDEWQALQVHGG